MYEIVKKTDFQSARWLENKYEQGLELISITPIVEVGYTRYFIYTFKHR